MATQLGRLLIIQKPNGENWDNVCGINTANFRVLNDIVESKVADCTDRSVAPIRKRKYGGKDIQFGGTGIFEDDANGKLLADAAVNQTVLTGWRVFVPGYGTFTGNWVLPSFEFSGDLDNDMNFSAEVQAAGAIEFATLS